MPALSQKASFGGGSPRRGPLDAANMLSAGTTIGPYEVIGTLGAGGMGEVYRARDTQLDRAVALKVLPQAFAADPDRLMRFTREAKALAALNHPNIAAIYGIESGALVMELVEGEDLSAVIARGPVPVPEALALARQLVDALEAAHDAGIVHRDLKPGNIKLRPDGTIKVLDFGLAKAAGAEGADTHPDLRNSPTFTAQATRVGVVLGTAAYMSPEQARGRTIDKRADIWAFGVVLYEVLVGGQLFAGETISYVLAAVLTRDVDLDRLPAATPSSVRRLLTRCLERDPRRRLRDIGDARADLDDAGVLEAQAPSPRRVRVAWVPWAAAGIAAAALLWMLAVRPQPSASRLDGHFTIQLPVDAALVTSDVPAWSQGPLVIAPDGRQIVYVAPGPRGRRLVARALNDLTPRVLPGTDGARLPFFSPDGQWIGFFADGKLKKVMLAGGTPATLADAPDGAGASWTEDGRILFAPALSSGLYVVSDAGGTARRLTTLDAAAGDDVHAWPQVLPGGRRALLTVIAWSRETSSAAVVDLTTGSRRTLLEDVSFVRYAAGEGARGGHLFFVRNETLMAAPYDPSTDAPAGTPVPVLERVRPAQFDVSRSGVLAYVPGTGAPTEYSLVWVTRDGEAKPINALRREYEDLNLSPDGTAVMLTIEEPGPDTPAHVWLADTVRGTLTRLTFDGFSRDPVWAPDGKSFVFGSKRGETFGLYVQRLDGGGAELAWQSPTPIWPDPQSWTPDGGTIVFSTKGAETHDDIWTLTLADRRAQPWLQTPSAEWAGRLSPDGAWMAYVSNESGRDEVYVQPFPGPGMKRLVSEGGGINPIWSRDGRELFYRRGAEIVATSIETTGGVRAGTSRPLFTGRYRLSGRDFDVSPDGTRFVMMRTEDARTSSTINLLLDWTSLVRP